MKLKRTLLFCSIFALFNGMSQTFKHGAGIQMNIGIFKETYSDITGLNNPVFYARIPGLMYRGAMGFRVNQSTTFNVSTYPSVGFFMNGPSSNKIAFDVPVLAELYFGDVDYQGAYIGAGAGFSYASNPDFGSGMVLGPQIEGGLQFPINERPLTFRVAYTFGLNNTSTRTFSERSYSKEERGIVSFGLMYVFGY